VWEEGTKEDIWTCNGGSNGSMEKLHNEDHRDYYSLVCVIKMMILRRVSWVGHVACIGDPRNAYRILID